MLFESRLPEGRRVVFRPIEPSDKEILAAGFARLSPESRYRRFFRSIDHLSDAHFNSTNRHTGRRRAAISR